MSPGARYTNSHVRLIRTALKHCVCAWVDAPQRCHCVTAPRACRLNCNPAPSTRTTRTPSLRLPALPRASGAWGNTTRAVRRNSPTHTGATKKEYRGASASPTPKPARPIAITPAVIPPKRMRTTGRANSDRRPCRSPARSKTLVAARSPTPHSAAVVTLVPNRAPSKTTA